MAARSMPVLILVTILALAGPGAASAGELRLSFLNGRVTLVARDVPLREVLAEWERVGGTHIVNRDTAPATPVTLDLTDVPEARALDVLLRQAAGYVASERIAPGETDSRFTQVVIMPGAAKLAAVPPAGPGPSGALPGFRTEERPRVQQMRMPGSRAEDAGEEPARSIDSPLAKEEEEEEEDGIPVLPVVEPPVIRGQSLPAGAQGSAARTAPGAATTLKSPVPGTSKPEVVPYRPQETPPIPPPPIKPPGA